MAETQNTKNKYGEALYNNLQVKLFKTLNLFLRKATEAFEACRWDDHYSVLYSLGLQGASLEAGNSGKRMLQLSR